MCIMAVIKELRLKFLHTSDWHLGARLGEYSRLEEQRAVLAEIRGIAVSEEVDFVIIAGDIFDTFNPSSEAVELLYRELKLLASDGNRPVIVIAGNHDSPDRIEAPEPLAAECGIFFIGYPDHTAPAFESAGGIRLGFPENGFLIMDMPGKEQVRIITTPYANEFRLRRYLAGGEQQELNDIVAERWKELAERYFDDVGINLLTAHLFMAADDGQLAEPEEEKSILHPGGLGMISSSALPPGLQYAALGHLHRRSEVEFPGGGPAVFYSGSPLAFGLSEENQQKSVQIVELEPGGQAEARSAAIDSGRRIVRKVFKSVDAAVEWLDGNAGCYVELQIESDDFISAGDRRRLMAAHDGITAVIPLLGDDTEAGGQQMDRLPDLSASLEELFRSYFEYAKGIPPDEALMEIFREITAEDGEADET